MALLRPRLFSTAGTRIVCVVLVAGLTGCAWPSRDLAGRTNATPAPSTRASPSSGAPSIPIAPSPTPLPDEPGRLAEQLVSVETAIRSDTTRPRRIPLLGRSQQEAYRELAAHPEWIPIVLSRVPLEVRTIIEANLMANAELRALNNPVVALPRWRIVAPPPPDELLGYYREAESKFGVRWAYLAAIHFVETNMGRIQGPSSAGALGPMQFLPSTWAYYGEGDINNPHDAILAAARYLSATGAPTNMLRALYAYNPSQRYARAISLYAQQMLANERAYLGYYYWQVYVSTARGDVLLEEGYGS